MMRRRVVYPVLLAALLSASGTVVRAQTNGDVAVTNLEGQPRYSADQIDNLTGPIALYPDALLAQVLVASTFPDQISDAAAYVRANGTANIDAQQWDISVKAVAHYASALNAMADKLDWTTALGTAYASQSSEVMQSIQRLRAMASANGNLNTTSQQQVITQGTTYEIVPVQPQVIYVPVYDPYVIYSRPIFNLGLTSRYWSFGVGFPIGGWLSYDCDWGLQRVYYNGWAPSYYAYAGNWRARSRPYVRLTDIYVSPRYRNVYVNRTVVTRYVDYRNVDRYASVHRDTHFEGRYDNRDTRREGNNNGNNGRPVNGGGYQAPHGGNNGNNDVRNGNGNNDGRNNNGNNDGRNNNGSNTGRGNGGNANGTSGNVRGGAQNPGTPGRVAMPRDRRNEPATRTDGSQPQLVVPQRTPEQPQRGGDQPQRSGDQQRNGGRQYDIQQRGAPQQQPAQQQQAQQQQAQEQRRAQPAPQQRQAPSQGARVEPQRQAPQVQQKAEPPKGRTAEPRGRGGDGKGGDRGDRGNRRG